MALLRGTSACDFHREACTTDRPIADGQPHATAPPFLVDMPGMASFLRGRGNPLTDCVPIGRRPLEMAVEKGASVAAEKGASVAAEKGASSIGGIST